MTEIKVGDTVNYVEPPTYAIWLKDSKNLFKPDGLTIFTASKFYEAELRRIYQFNLEDGVVVEAKTFLKALEAPVFPFYSQRDDPWKDDKLGFGNTTIGQYGCVITSMAMMLSHAMNAEITPPLVNEGMVRVKGFTGENGNEVLWAYLARAFPAIQFISYNHYETTAAPTDYIDAALSHGDYIIVRVDHNLNTSDVDDHFILITGGNEDQYTIHDPWLLPADQRALTIPDAYCKVGWTPSRAIFSIARYAKAS